MNYKYDSDYREMTLRQYYAGQALIAFAGKKDDVSYDYIAKKCFLFADSMIKEAIKADKQNKQKSGLIEKENENER